MTLILLKVSDIDVTVSVSFIAKAFSHIAFPAALVDANHLLFGDTALLQADLIDRLPEVYSHAVALLEALFAGALPYVDSCVEIVSGALFGLGEVHGAEDRVLVYLALTLSQAGVDAFSETLLQHDVAWLYAHVAAQKGSFFASETT